MNHVDLELTYRGGRPRLGYLYLSEDPNEKSEHSRRVGAAMVIDLNKGGKLIGIELLAPSMVTLEAINGILKEYGMEPLKESDLAPLLAG